MPCYHPLLRVQYYPQGHPNDTNVKVVPYVDDVKHAFFSQAKYVVLDSTQIPCGQCIGCRLDYSRQWANRCMLELEYHDSAYFVTLTYNDDHVPVSYYGDPETGLAMPSLTLRKRDFQLFMKRLRKANPNDKIRFFAAGEYGDKTFRPHYHAIIFGLHLDDLQVYKRSPDGQFTYYNSPHIQRAWSVRSSNCEGSTTPLTEPIGYAVVAPVTWNTCAYTARYVMKKLKGNEAQFYSDFNIEPPFTLMSRKPGIARQWYDDHPDCYDYEYINISTPEGGKKFRPPRYFDKLFDLDNPEESAELKEVRKKMAEASKAAKLEKTSLSYLDMLQVEENAKMDKLKKLIRSVD